MFKKTKFKIFVGVLLISLVIPLYFQAAQIGESQEFYVESSYDLSERSQLSTTLVKITPELYFYIDEKWWSFSPQNEVYQTLSSLGEEFKNKIYPFLTSTFGQEWKPGIDGEERITILIHPMREEVGGYFKSGDEYSRLQVSNSNEREMVYLNANYITNLLAKSFLAHEFQHLITFNQQEREQGIVEEVWLNEARSETAITLLGYDDIYEGSNLQKRVERFLKNPSDSITEWQNKPQDYGVLNLFFQYLVDHYGKEILIDSLHSKKVGIPSLNEALSKNGSDIEFSQIFTDWTIAVLVNDCTLGEKYCYLNQNLKDLHIVPLINFLPLTGESALTLIDTTKNWSGNWYKFVGGKGDLKFEFEGNPSVEFKIPYVIRDSFGDSTIEFLLVDKNQKGEIFISDFGTQNVSLVIIPSIQNEVTGFDGFEPSYQFSWSASIVKTQEEAELIKKLLAQIEELKREINKVLAEINAILATQGEKPFCQKLENNLYYGLMNNQEVRCLQEFLKSQGSEIYPEGLVTGNFLSLTKTAAIRFQEKYAKDILAPWELTEGTGFVGRTTRAKINEILGR
ncbi:hypothetical protein KJA15_02790 [Patescibacteria group bacterium]|nr:hypothetical protein [Patescibacteria group bacterium]